MNYDIVYKINTKVSNCNSACKSFPLKYPFQYQIQKLSVAVEYATFVNSCHEFESYKHANVQYCIDEISFAKVHNRCHMQKLAFIIVYSKLVNFNSSIE